MSKFYKYKLDNILENSKEENLKYLNEILNIKNISEFDAILIMSQLKLNPDIINLIKSALEKYEKDKDINSKTSYDDFLYRLITNIKMLDSSLKFDISDKNSSNFKVLLNFIFNKSISLFESKLNMISSPEIKFSKVY